MAIRSVYSLLWKLCLFALVMFAVSTTSIAQIGISIRIGPPPLPVYEQPPCPAEGYIWTPGYWNYDYDIYDYYWVPGTWVMAPQPGYLWTPGYWGWRENRFFFNEGYWGPRVGFYGGINYGFGYFGEGYEGGRWDGGRFFYNRSVNNINVTNIHNVYNTTVIRNTTVINRVSYNGGNGGINARPRAEDEAAERDRHIPPVAAQTQHLQAARADPQLRAAENRGKPPIAATPRPGDLKDRAAVPAREAGGAYNPPANRGEGNGSAPRPENNVPRPGNQPASGAQNNVPRPPVHPRDLPQPERPPAPNTGDPKADQKYQQKQDKLFAKEDQQRQKLQQKQDRDHEKLQKQKADDAKQQQIEQKHQQQTQRLEQKQQKEQQRMQPRQQQPARGNPSRPSGERH